jgi:uncharacterized membrane protein YfcA
MDWSIQVMLFAAGVVGGGLSALVGGASLVTFPTLLATGMSPISATVAGLVALMPAILLASTADRSQLPALDRGFWGLVFASSVGALIGGALLLLTPTRWFEVMIPPLMAFATFLFAFSGRISQWLRARSVARSGREPHISVTSIPMLLPVSVYGGYFGAGVGVLLLAVLMLATAGDYRSANVTKNLVSGINSIFVGAYFWVTGAIPWPETLVLMAGAVIGGVAGGHLARIAPTGLMRVVIVLIGAALTVAYTWRYWF